MVMSLRRVVTGHDANGNAIVKIDEIAQHWREGRPGGMVCNVWTTDTLPANNSLDVDGGKREGKFTMIPNGSVFRILHFSPGLERRMHRTDSIDYLIVMSGEIDMELDIGVEVHLKQGDVMVQRGHHSQLDQSRHRAVHPRGDSDSRQSGRGGRQGVARERLTHARRCRPYTRDAAVPGQPLLPILSGIMPPPTACTKGLRGGFSYFSPAPC